MNKASAMRLIDWIWMVRGTLPLPPGVSGDEAFARLDDLMREPGTTRRIDGDVLVFNKVNALAQDKLSVFDRGRLQIEPGSAGPVMRYDLVSRALGWCFLLPLFFLGVSALIDSSKISGKVFAGFFVVLYIGGRWLEPRLVAKVFARRLAGTEPAQPALSGMERNGAT